MVNYDAQEGFSVTSTTVVDTAVTRVTQNSENSLILTNKKLNNERSENKDKEYNTNKTMVWTSKSQLSPYLLSPTSSILSLEVVNFHHAGNYTCAPSNARAVSITVHVLRGSKTNKRSI
ncbi:PREDICTED: uncharacterized protein LOC108974465 isoform X2 [Bactrocera latifrons]|nr:PREDICTED: uncharacterized protein LOC108974465 isoform X2 [Bactrocera latifrons]